MLSAIRYCKFVMGFECMDGILCSKRLKGLSDVLFTGKRKLQQAVVLTVQQVKMLHEILEDQSSDEFDRASAGYLLSAIYGRCRVSDLTHLEMVTHDHDSSFGFIELFTATHKTGRSAVRKTTLLPILIPAFGVTNTNWAEHAMRAFNKVGLEFSGRIQGPLLRPPSHEGPFLCRRSVTSSEVGKLLRGLIGLDVEIRDKQVAHVSSHSLKATGLAWCSRYGMSWPDRAILGRHQSHTNEAVAIYSRDLAVGPVTRFGEMLKAIHQGTFCPDAARSKYFPFPPVPPAGVHDGSDPSDQLFPQVANADESAESCKRELHADGCDGEAAILVDSASDSSESASSDGSIASESEEEDQPAAKRLNRTNVGARDSLRRDDAGWMVHKRSGLLHHCSSEQSGNGQERKMTACGRTVNQNYVPMDETTDGNVLCAICQRRSG
eukprot:s1782_g23.t1